MAHTSKLAMRGVALFGASVMALGLGACSGGKSDSSSGASGGQVTVEMWDYLSGDTANSSIEASIAEFEKANPDIKVKRTTFAFADLSKSILQGSVGGEVPDVAVVDVVDNQNFASLGMLKDLSGDGINKSDFFDGPWSSVEFDGKTYGIPLNSNNLALYYNKTMLKEAGVEVPTDWASLKEAAKKTTKGDVKGLAISAVKNESGTFQLLPFVWQTGGDMSNYSESGATALAYLRGMIEDGSVSEAVVNYTQEDARTQFITGKAAMMINGPWELSTLNKDAEIEWDVAPLPKDKRAATSMGGENVVVMNGAKQSEAAVKLAKYLTSALERRQAQGLRRPAPVRTRTRIRKGLPEDFRGHPAVHAGSPDWCSNPRSRSEEGLGDNHPLAAQELSGKGHRSGEYRRPRQGPHNT